MLNFELVERLLCFVVAACSFSHVCWQVFSPGAEISQNSVIFVPLSWCFLILEDKGKMLAEGKQEKEEKVSAINTAVKALPEEKHLLPYH